MNVKDLSIHLSCLTIHALLVTAFGFILMSLTVLAGHVASWLNHPGDSIVRAVQVALEVPFYLTILSLAVNASREPLSELSLAALSAIVTLRQLIARTLRGEHAGGNRLYLTEGGQTCNKL